MPNVPDFDYRRIQEEYEEVPPITMQSLISYGRDHKPVGGFLHACLTNRFIEACSRADGFNRECLHGIASLIWNELPAACWGSEEKVKAWLEAKP